MNKSSIPPILMVPQVQALLDVAHVAYRAECAAYYVVHLFSPTRSKETPEILHHIAPYDGVIRLSAEMTMGNPVRQTTHFENFRVMAEALISTNVFTIRNLRPPPMKRTVIQILAGFSSDYDEAQERADRERNRLADMGISLPLHNWGVPFSRNILGRTALAMHYRLFCDKSLTGQWAGICAQMVRPNIKHLVTHTAARQYWTMLPTSLRTFGIKVSLPANHRLNMIK